MEKLQSVMSPCSSRTSGKAGFSLIELMVVIVVIGVLAALAIPKYTGVSNKAKAVEAHTNLNFLYDLELSYHQLHDHFIIVDEGIDSRDIVNSCG